jgi:hypothetical protein
MLKVFRYDFFKQVIHFIFIFWYQQYQTYLVSTLQFNIPLIAFFLFQFLITINYIYHFTVHLNSEIIPLY